MYMYVDIFMTITSRDIRIVFQTLRVWDHMGSARPAVRCDMA